MNIEVLGSFIRARREALNLSQAQLADRAGIGQAYVFRIENGLQLGSVDSLVKLAGGLDVEPGVLVNIYAGLGTKYEGAVNIPPNLTEDEAQCLNSQVGYILYLRSLDATDRKKLERSIKNLETTINKNHEAKQLAVNLEKSIRKRHKTNKL